jgi:hypothetical protein
MERSSDKLEAGFLGAIRIDNAIIDKALQAGLTAGHFADIPNREQWKLAVEMRTEGAEVSDAGLYAKAHSLGILANLGGMDRLLSTGTGSALGYEQMLASLIDA